MQHLNREAGELEQSSSSPESEHVSELDRRSATLIDAVARTFDLQPSHAQRRILMQTLNSPSMLELSDGQFASLFGLDFDDDAVFEKFSQDTHLQEQRAAPVAYQLQAVFRDRLRPERVSRLQIDAPGTVSDLPMSETDLRAFLATIATNNQKTTQGGEWNVLLLEHAPIVLKVLRSADEWERKQPLDAVKSYPELSKAFGPGILPGQALLGANGQEPILVQEKIDLRPMVLVNQRTMEEMQSGHEENNPVLDDKWQAIRTALAQSANQEKLAHFLDAADRLSTPSVSYMPSTFDFSGENLFLGVDQSGQLQIKFLDFSRTYVDGTHPGVVLVEQGAKEVRRALRQLLPDGATEAPSA